MTLETLICIFCSCEVSDEIAICLSCNDYKGIMTLGTYRSYYPEMFADEFGDLDL